MLKCFPVFPDQIFYFLGRTCDTKDLTFCRGNLAETKSGLEGFSKECTEGEVELMKVPVGFVFWIKPCINIAESPV